MAGRKAIDMTGLKFGQLTVLRRAEQRSEHWHWECVCDCGRTCSPQGTDLRLGRVRSCGHTRRKFSPRSFCGTENTDSF